MSGLTVFNLLCIVGEVDAGEESAAVSSRALKAHRLRQCNQGSKLGLVSPDGAGGRTVEYERLNYDIKKY